MESPRKQKVIFMYQTSDREAVQELLPTLPLQTLKVLRKMRGSVIGEEANIHTPFGRKCSIYADYAATGRCSSQVEDFLESKVYPYFAKGTAKSSYVARHTASVREEGRTLILKQIARPQVDHYALLFLTNPLEKLIQLLSPRPIVVFLTNTEHPSIVGLWKEAQNVRLEIISGDHDKGCDFHQLEDRASQAASKFPSALRIGYFSAGSLTGRFFDVDRIAAICHSHGMKVCIDYSPVCGYVDIQLGGESQLGFSKDWVHSDLDPSCYKDAAIIASHKLIGGPGSTSLLAVRRDLLKKGMTNEESKDLAEINQGQTPNYLADIRTALAF